MFDYIKNLLRALRLPFVSVSVLPFILGSLLAKRNFNAVNFLLGLFAVLTTHLSANLINDYADSKSGADWQDRKFYNFFGGSKLIQENKFSEAFYLRTSILLSSLACLSIALLALFLRNPAIIGFYIIILLLAWSYSEGPLRLSYRGLGEVVIFILFGPALVMGGYFIQTGIFPDIISFLISLPLGFLTTAVLFANEIPDFPTDEQSGKHTWIKFTGQEKAFMLYYVLIFCAFFFIALGVAFGYLGLLSLASLIFIFPALKAANILKTNFDDKIRLMDSSKLTIAAHSLVNVILILEAIL
jgi:1,4-dihydroxy-2-naphthoate octaprenyltransferase